MITNERQRMGITMYIKYCCSDIYRNTSINFFSKPFRNLSTNLSLSFVLKLWIYKYFLSELIFSTIVPGVKAIRLVSIVISKSDFKLCSYVIMAGVSSNLGLIISFVTSIFALIISYKK